MGMSLKDQNKLPLLSIAIANLAIFTLLAYGTNFQISDWSSASMALRGALPLGVALILIGVLNAQLSSDTKARIVFARWVNPLPSAEAFSRYARQDPRIDFVALDRLFGPFPAEPHEQSARWYQLYQTIGDEPSVRQAHREYLFTRDYACIAFMLVFAFGPLGCFEIPSATTALLYWALLIVQLIVVARAARTHGRRMVTTVLALKAAGR
jgi:hypothetical protein